MLRWLYLALVLIITTACAPPAQPPLGTSQTPIILISIDTLRADHLHCYGYERKTSPNLDQFAEQGILFERCINTGGGTLPVHMSMLTSLTPTVHNVFPHNDRKLDDDRVTMAEHLRAEGYATGGFTDGGYVSGSFGFDQGFDTFFDRNYKGLDGKISSYFDDGGFAELMPRAKKWISERSVSGFFLFLHTYDVHSGTKKTTYDAPEPFHSRFVEGRDPKSFAPCREGRCASDLLRWINEGVRNGTHAGHDVLTGDELEFIVALYDGGITYVDHELGLFFDELKRLGLYDRSLIVITSDHGEEFLEHHRMLHHQNYEEVARVPLIMRLPGGVNAGTRVKRLFSTIDLMPTVLDFVGIDAPSDAMGRSARAAIEGDGKGRDFVFIAGGHEKLRTKKWSLLASTKAGVELYDLENDPTEEFNLIDQFPEIAAELFIKIEQARATERTIRDREQTISTEVQLDEYQLKNLKALGYVP